MPVRSKHLIVLPAQNVGQRISSDSIGKGTKNGAMPLVTTQKKKQILYPKGNIEVLLFLNASHTTVKSVSTNGKPECCQLNRHPKGTPDENFHTSAAAKNSQRPRQMV